MRIDFIPQITLGDSASVLTALVSLIIALAALYYAHLKAAKIDVFQKETDSDPRFPGGTQYGIPESIHISSSFYLENTGGAKATILSMQAKTDFTFDRDYLKLLTTDVFNPDDSFVYPPFILGDGDVRQFKATLKFILKQKPDEVHARLTGKGVQEELRSFPKLLSLIIRCNYRDGRGNEKVYEEPIEFTIGNKFEEMASNIEDEQIRLFPI